MTAGMLVDAQMMTAGMLVDAQMMTAGMLVDAYAAAVRRGRPCVSAFAGPPDARRPPPCFCAAEGIARPRRCEMKVS